MELYFHTLKIFSQCYKLQKQNSFFHPQESFNITNNHHRSRGFLHYHFIKTQAVQNKNNMKDFLKEKSLKSCIKAIVFTNSALSKSCCNTTQFLWTAEKSTGGFTYCTLQEVSEPMNVWTCIRITLRKK